MELVILEIFSSYIDAHILMGRLEEEGVRCWLKDENIVTIDPILTNAVGGIKLMVAKDQFERASSLVNQMNEERRRRFICPKCGSSDIELVTTPRKLSNWLGALGGAMGFEKIWHCFICKAEFEEPKEADNS